MDYKAKYEEALEDMRVIYHNLKGDAKLAVEHAFPELRESYDERIRKGIVETIKQCPDTFLSPKNRDEMLAYLEKQKEHPMPDSTELIKLWDKEEAMLRDEDFRGDEWRLAYTAFLDGFAIGATRQKGQKPADGKYYSSPDCGTTAGYTSDESECDNDYRVGKTFSGLIPCWVNAPSELQPAHKYHGKNIVAMHENNGGFRCVCVDDEQPITFHLPENTLLVEGWRKQKPERNEKPCITCDEYDKGYKQGYTEGCTAGYNKAMLEQKQEWSEEDNIGWDEAFACVTRAEKAAKNEEELQNAVTAEKWLKEIKFKYYVHPVKQEWSEDIIQKAVKEVGLTQHQIDWFKTNVFPPKHEWSEEDEKNLELVTDCVYEYYPDAVLKYKLKDWLKSLRPQPKCEWDEEYREEDVQTRFAFYTYKDDPSVLYLSNVFVEEASRNHGFGARILKAAEKAAEAIGATTIRLKVKQDSPANVWYRKNGYGYMTFEDGYDWLEKNLEYMKPTKQEWSEEDKEAVITAISACRYMAENFENSTKQYEDAIKRLKSLHLQPKQEWSAEDEENFEWFDKFFRAESVIAGGRDIPQDKYLWFKSLRTQPKHEWSEEDEDMLNSCISSIEEAKENRYAYKETDGDTSYDHEINFLKSLRNRAIWKSSEDDERLINTSISFLKDFADKGYENAVECIDWLKSKLNGNTGK